MGSFHNHTPVLDQALIMDDGGTAVTATATSEVGGSAKTLDLGDARYLKGQLVLDVTALEIATNERYAIKVEGAEASSFSTSYELAARVLGDSSVTNDTQDSTAGRYVLKFDNVGQTADNEQKPMRYLRVRYVVSGTVSTGMTLTAHIAEDK